MPQGVKNVAEVAKRIGAHVVLVSSAYVTPKNRYEAFNIPIASFSLPSETEVAAAASHQLTLTVLAEGKPIY